MSGKLPIALQFKWRDEALRIRERRGFLNLKHLVDFIELRAEAANDPVFGRVVETSKSGRKYPRGGHQTLPHIPRGAVDSKVMTKATQVGLSGSENPPVSNKHPNPTTQKSVGGKCYNCGSAHRIERCPDFISKSVRERIILARNKGLCLNCLRKEHFATQCQSSFRCKQCQQLHHSFLHKTTKDKKGAGVNLQENSDSKEQANVNATTSEPIAPIQTTNHTYSMTSRTKVALQVVPVKIMNNDGHSVTTYALLYTGSEETFLLKKISDRLELEVKNCNTLAVCTMSGESSVKVGEANV